MARRSFTREFKLESVREVREHNVSMAQVASDLDIQDIILRRWVREYLEDNVNALTDAGKMKPD